MNERQSKSHSEEFFVPTRDYWWNDDYLALLAQRWKLAEVRSALDVGCGVGHWTRRLGAHLPGQCRIIGVDPEPRWVTAAQPKALGDARMSFQQGRAEELPFADAHLDLVTCQTVLIHVKDPETALREMFRVLRPGGLLVAVEPNHAMGAFPQGQALRQTPLEDLLSLVRLHETCLRGKHALGEGWNSLGEELPGLLAKLGAKEIHVYVRDTANALWPPYEEPNQRVFAAEVRDHGARGFWGWGREASLRYFLAGGGTLSQFEALWATAVRSLSDDARALDGQRLSAGGGSVNYVISARRP